MRSRGRRGARRFLSALSLGAHRTPALPHGLADIWLPRWRVERQHHFPQNTTVGSAGSFFSGFCTRTFVASGLVVLLGCFAYLRHLYIVASGAPASIDSEGFCGPPGAGRLTRNRT